MRPPSQVSQVRREREGGGAQCAQGRIQTLVLSATVVP